MSIYFTNAPEEYDYSGTVLKSVPLSMRFKGSRARPFRMVILDDRENGYYRDYQIGRYHSGMYLVMIPEKFEQEVKEGYLEADEGK
jgi:hypothetical protein